MTAAERERAALLAELAELEAPPITGGPLDRLRAELIALIEGRLDQLAEATS